ncbi:MAG: hypothetical protein F6K48_24675 [Okeania sp. SIO3H1]|nr:hypothetical protein [Okeania sp. SIO3H1]
MPINHIKQWNKNYSAIVIFRVNYYFDYSAVMWKFIEFADHIKQGNKNYSAIVNLG